MVTSTLRRSTRRDHAFQSDSFEVMSDLNEDVSILHLFSYLAKCLEMR